MENMFSLMSFHCPFLFTTSYTAAYLPMINTLITKTGSIHKVSKAVNSLHNHCLAGVTSTEMKTKLQPLRQNSLSALTSCNPSL